jgi:hypothetical protein
MQEAPQWLKEAIEKYKAKLDFVALEFKLRERKEEMDRKSVIAQVELDNLQRLVRNVLAKFGILSDWNAAYISFGEELMVVKKRFHPTVWKWPVDYYRELKILAQKWVNRGLRKDVMIEISKVVGTPEIENYLQEQGG